jgi:hypothetical protein
MKNVNATQVKSEVKVQAQKVSMGFAFALPQLPAPPYAEGSKKVEGLSQNRIDREIKAKGLLSLFFISVCY